MRCGTEKPAYRGLGAPPLNLNTWQVTVSVIAAERSVAIAGADVVLDELEPKSVPRSIPKHTPSHTGPGQTGPSPGGEPG